MHLDQLRREFENRALEPETLFLLRPQDALAFLDAGKSAGLTLAGVEGFFVTSGAYQPIQEFSTDSCDFASSDAKAFESETRKIIKKGELAGVWFQVVFERIN